MGTGFRLLMGIPTLRANPRTPNWIEALANLHMPLGSTMERYWVADLPIAEARNRICAEAVRGGFDAVFMLGDDVLAPANTLLAMLARLGRTYPTPEGGAARCDMVTGVYWTKTYPAFPYLWRGLLDGPYTDWRAGELVAVDFAGCDCLMVTTDALRRMGEPYFSTDYDWGGDITPPRHPTEDFYFFARARAAGLRLWADTDLQCLHEDRATGAYFGLTKDMPQAGGTPDDADGGRVIAELGAGTWCRTYGDGCTVVRFDIDEATRPDVRCDVRALPAAHFGRYDVVHAHHVLEHLPYPDTATTLAHWTRLLRPGGELRVRVPNLAHAMRTLLDPEAPGERKEYAFQQLYGTQTNEWQAHKQGFTAEGLGRLLGAVPGLAGVRVVEETDGHNLFGSATLAEPPRRAVIADLLTAGRAAGA